MKHIDPKTLPQAAPPKPHALDPLIAWLRTRHPAERYDWHDPERCVVGQFLTATGFVSNGTSHDQAHVDVCGGEDACVYIGLGGPVDVFRDPTHNWTMGGALARALDVRQRQVVMLVDLGYDDLIRAKDKSEASFIELFERAIEAVALASGRRRAAGRH